MYRENFTVFSKFVSKTVVSKIVLVRLTHKRILASILQYFKNLAKRYDRRNNVFTLKNELFTLKNNIKKRINGFFPL